MVSRQVEGRVKEEVWETQSQNCLKHLGFIVSTLHAMKLPHRDGKLSTVGGSGGALAQVGIGVEAPGLPPLQHYLGTQHYVPCPFSSQ